MLIVSRQDRDAVRNLMARTMRTERLIGRIVLNGAKPNIVTRSWREFWEPCVRFSGSDTRLVHRLNRLKAAWRAILRPRTSRLIAARYCWRYFGLLHHAIRIGIERGTADELLSVLRRIIPLARAILAAESAKLSDYTWKMLDLGSGTGHLIGQLDHYVIAPSDIARQLKGAKL